MSTLTRNEVISPTPALDQRVPIVLLADEWGGVGGTAGYVVMLGRELAHRGFGIVALCHPGPGTQHMREQLQASDVRVELLPESHGPPVIRQLRGLVALVRLLRPHKRGVLALMMGYFTRGGAAILAARLAGMRAVVRADLTPPEPPVTRTAAKWLRLKDLLTDRVVVGAVENIHAFREETGRSPGKVSVIHTGIELGRFVPGSSRAAARAGLGYKPEDLVVGTVARLDDERKGIRDFLQAAAFVSSEAPPKTRFLVVGDGVHRPAYEELAGDLGIKERTLFAGWRTDVPQFLDAMDVFVMPSTYEGGPTSVLEAMAMAKATVSTRVGMVPEVIEDGVTGLIVEPRDASGLAAALRRLIADDALRAALGARAREKALSSLSVERMTDDYLALFAALLGRRA
jgi:glycosyltransferase involved in cell wall biosynthesis